MAKKKPMPKGFKEFLSEYNATVIPKGKHINSSKYTVDQQLGRFDKFSHSKEECEVLLREARSL